MWINEISNNKELKKHNVDKLWNSLILKKKSIQKELFSLLYDFRDAKNNYRMISSNNPYNKSWLKRYYNDLKAWKLIKKHIPELENQAYITDQTADRVFQVISWINYVQDHFDNRIVQSDPINVVSTSDLLKHNYKAIQLSIDFEWWTSNPIIEESDSFVREDNVLNLNKSTEKEDTWYLSQELLDELYKENPLEPEERRKR